MNKITIECSQDEAFLIERALDMYSRIGILQFEYLTMCSSLQKLIWNKKLHWKFELAANNMKAVFDYHPNSHAGIFNTEDVQDDVRTAAHLYQIMRHERYLHRKATGEQLEDSYTVDEYPADICNIAKIKIPNFKMTIKDEGEAES